MPRCVTTSLSSLDWWVANAGDPGFTHGALTKDGDRARLLTPRLVRPLARVSYLLTVSMPSVTDARGRLLSVVPPNGSSPALLRARRWAACRDDDVETGTVFGVEHIGWLSIIGLRRSGDGASCAPDSSRSAVGISAQESTPRSSTRSASTWSRDAQLVFAGSLAAPLSACRSVLK